MSAQYHIGKLGEKYGLQEKQQWLAEQNIKRSYQQEAEEKILALPRQDFDIETYGKLDYPVGSYILYVIKTKNWYPSKPYVLITRGVQGYETINRWNPNVVDPNRSFYLESSCRRLF